jgi:hypothetical protein
MEATPPGQDLDFHLSLGISRNFAYSLSKGICHSRDIINETQYNAANDIKEELNCEIFNGKCKLKSSTLNLNKNAC